MSIWNKFDTRDSKARNHKAQHTQVTHIFGKQADEAVDAFQASAKRWAEEKAKAQAGKTI